VATPSKYMPETVISAGERVPVLSYHVYPPGQAPKGIPTHRNLAVVECRTKRGSRWYGCERAYIDSTLRMVIVGYKGAESDYWEVGPMA